MQRILVVANRTCPCPGLHDFVHEHTSQRPAEITVVAPALNSRLRHYLSDTDDARTLAAARLADAIEHLERDGVTVFGVVGDAEPLQAIEDALADFPADAIVLSTHPAGTSHWLERGLIEKVNERLDVPVHHYVSEYDLPEPEAAPPAVA